MKYVLIHLAKDLRLEWRSKDAINGMLFFALMVVVLFSLAFDPTAAISRQIDRKSTRLNSSHPLKSRMPSSA